MKLKDIAKEVGVSISTVSRVINHKGANVASKEIQDKIWDIVQKSGYTPNLDAQNLRKSSHDHSSDKNNNTFACIFARSNDLATDSFFVDLGKAIEYEAYKYNYFLKYSFLAKDINDGYFNQVINSHSVSGLIIMGRFDKDKMKSVTETHKHVVYVGLNPFPTKHDLIFCDGYKASMTAIDYLYKLGHRKIAYIGERMKENRYRGYIDGLAKYNLPQDSKNVVTVKLSAEGGYYGASALLARNVDITAIFCANDATAVGTIKALKENNLKVPQDISVMGIDDIELAQFVSPMLTTIHIPIEELGRHAVKTLIDRISHGHNLPVKLELPFRISVRDSCGKPPV